MRSVLYARVSLEEQAEQFGLASQLRLLLERATASGYDVSDPIVDDGYSGADLDRPGLSKIRDLVKARAVDVVLVHDPDRLSRKLAHQAILLEEFERAGVRLVFITMPPADTPEAKMLLSMKSMFAEYEREKIRERTLRGRREKARQGFIVGGRVAFGYKYLGKVDGERGRLAIDEKQAAIVRQIFGWAADGMSVRAIVTRLNEMLVQPSLAPRWGRSSVSRLLRNRTYVGEAHYNRFKRSEPTTPGADHRLRHNKYTALKERPESEWITVPAPAIIDRALFDRVAESLKRNRLEFAGRPSRRYLLRGLLRCGKCGRRMHGDPNHGKPAYRCIGRDPMRLSGEPCHASIAAQRLDAAVWRAVSKPFRDPARLRAIVEQHYAKLKQPDSRRRVEQLERLIGQLKTRESRAVRALLDAGLKDHYAQIRGDLTEVGRQRRRLESEARDLRQSAMPPDSVEAICREISAVTKSLSGDQKKEFIRRIVEHVAFAGEDVEIRCALPPVMVAAPGLCPQHQHVVPAGRRHL